MKTKLSLVMIITVCISINAAMAQSDTTALKSDSAAFTLSGVAEKGSAYAPLFGVVISDHVADFICLDVQHKSGFGIGGYRMDDYQTIGTGRINFIDLYWKGDLTENWKLYGAMEYGFFDNDSQLSFWCPYVMVFWENPVVNIDFSPMYCYYDRLKSSEVVIRLRGTKAVTKKGTEAQLSVWYGSAVDKNWYGSVGISQKLPKGLYAKADQQLLKGLYAKADLLVREGKIHYLWGVGIAF